MENKASRASAADASAGKIIIWNSIANLFSFESHSISVHVSTTFFFFACAQQRTLTFSLAHPSPLINLSNHRTLRYLPHCICLLQNLWAISTSFHICAFSWKCAWTFRDWRRERACVTRNFSLNHCLGNFHDSHVRRLSAGLANCSPNLWRNTTFSRTNYESRQFAIIYRVDKHFRNCRVFIAQQIVDEMFTR